MVTIHAALSAVEGASKEDIDKITAALASEGFSSTEPVEGLFKSLDLASLTMNAKQRTIAQMAQRKGDRIGHCEWHNLGMSAWHPLVACAFPSQRCRIMEKTKSPVSLG